MTTTYRVPEADPHHEATVDLAALGFTDLEAAAYVHLLRVAPATGYRLAHAVGKPVANIYKAIDSLAAKGAVIVEEGETRLVRAVPPAEVIGRLRRTYTDRCDSAETSLSRVHAAEGDDRVYTLRSFDAVVERARDMLRRATFSAMIDVFPEPAPALRDAAVDAAARGVTVHALLYEPADWPGVSVTCAPPGTPIQLLAWQILDVVVDGAEHLAAALRWGSSEVEQAVWTASAFIATQQHDHLICQIYLKRAMGLAAQGAPAKAFADAFETLRPVSTRHTPGYRGLARRLGDRRTETAETPTTPPRIIRTDPRAPGAPHAEKAP